MIAAPMDISRFQYDLPESLIAQYPADTRDHSRLLHLDPEGIIADTGFCRFPDLVTAGDLLVVNDTRVIPARLLGRKETGGRVEFLLERVTGPDRALGHLRSGKRKKPGMRLWFGSGGNEVTAVLLGNTQNLFELRFSRPLHEWMSEQGEIPLPPYIRRAPQAIDRERYQTVYAKNQGAVAAPTAGLHFREETFTALRERGVSVQSLTLHVGAGTFQPVREENLREKRLHAEYLEVSEPLCQAVQDTKAAGGRVIAVGTTSLRGLESAALSGQIRPYRGDTDLFILPGFRFHVADALLTNFHLPGSSLLMLVCAFSGYQRVMRAYQHAVRNSYRFFSYGDAMFIHKNQIDTE